MLRRFVLDWPAEEPWAPANEALVLHLLTDVPGVPAPRLLADDGGRRVPRSSRRSVAVVAAKAERVAGRIEQHSDVALRLIID